MTAPAHGEDTPVPEAASTSAGVGEWPGRRIVAASWGGSLAFAATAGLAATVPSTDLIALLVALGLFLAGTVAFTVAFVVAVRRSRTEEIVVASLFFLEGSAPRPVRRRLFSSLAVEVTVAFVTAGVRPNTSLAFGILAPLYGIGLAGLWGARHGVFPPRSRPVDRRRHRPPGQPDAGPGYHRPSDSD